MNSEHPDTMLGLGLLYLITTARYIEKYKRSFLLSTHTVWESEAPVFGWLKKGGNNVQGKGKI